MSRYGWVYCFFSGVQSAYFKGKQVRAQYHNQGGHTVGELQRAAKPPLGWVWGNFYQPWHRLFPGERTFNGDINLRREYVPLSLIELQRFIDLNWLKTSELVDLTQLCNTRLINVKHEWRQFGIHLTDEVCVSMIIFAYSFQICASHRVPTFSQLR